MKLFIVFIINILFLPVLLKAQSNNIVSNGHPTIKSFALKFDDANTAQVSTNIDSLVYINYVVVLKDTNNTNKIHVRISNGLNTDGSVYQVNYSITPKLVANNFGKILFKREKDVVFILTITSLQMADLNYEVATENFTGQISPYLRWNK
jgi:hypothetical protein